LTAATGPIPWFTVRLAIGVAILSWSAAALAGSGAVAVPEARALAAPIERGARVVGTLRAGVQVCVVETPNPSDPEPGEPRQWWMVQLSKSLFGFVRASDIQLVTPPNASLNRCDANGIAPSPAAVASTTRAVPDGGAAVAAPGLAADAASDRHSFTRRAPPEGLRAGGFLPLDPFRMTLGLMSGAGWLNRSAADQHHIGDVGPTFYVTIGMAFFDVIGVTSSFGAAFPADHASFQQDVMPLLGGSVTSASSSLQVTNYSIAVGPRTPPFVLVPADDNRAWVIALFADYGTSAIHGDRYIENCGDCRTEDLDLPGGTFWRVGADIGVVRMVPIDPGFLMTVSYQRYFANAGFTQELRVGFTLWFI
jgi:hypothetical protein